VKPNASHPPDTPEPKSCGCNSEINLFPNLKSSTAPAKRAITNMILLNESSRSPSVAQSYDNDVDPGIDQQSPLRADDDNDIPDIPLSRSISLDSYRPNNSPQISLDSNTPFYIGFSI